MNRSWIGIGLIIGGFISIVMIDSSCSKKSEEVKTVQFDPLADTDKKQTEKNAKAASKNGPKVILKKKRPSEFIVQVGSFAQKENAEKLVSRLKDRNYKVSMVEKENKKHGKLYLVRLEPTSDLEVARTQIDKLKAQENLDPVIVTK